MISGRKTAGSRSEKRLEWFASLAPSERKLISQKARQKILADLGYIAIDFGYSKRDNHFEKKRLTKRFSVRLQPSRSGFECFINLGVIHTLPFDPRGNEVYRLGSFYDKPTTVDGEPGALTYPDIVHETSDLAYACLVLRDRAIPFLETGKSRRELPNWLAKQPPIPKTALHKNAV